MKKMNFTLVKESEDEVAKINTIIKLISKMIKKLTQMKPVTKMLTYKLLKNKKKKRKHFAKW
jgi:hypothetical protein